MSFPHSLILYSLLSDLLCPVLLCPRSLATQQENLHDAKRKKAEQRKDPIHSKIPSQPIVSRGQNSNNQSFFFTKYVMEGRSKDTTGMEDPREALLKMDALAERDPIFFGRAYEKSQPVREMHSETFEQEQEQFKKRQKR